MGWEDPLKKEMATYSSILAWEIPWKSLVGYSPWGYERDRHALGINNRSWARDRHYRLELRTHVFMPREVTNN